MASTPPARVRIAVWGCGHGELDRVYASCAAAEAAAGDGVPISLLLCCGDFQCARTVEDLDSMECPPKYKAMHTFHKYYSGERRAPIPTLFIGGNHEAMAHLLELPYGGWVAPNMFFLGNSGVVQCEGLRIGGLSGIFNGGHYNTGYFERKPLMAPGDRRSAYHSRAFEYFKLHSLTGGMDVFMSHDWPEGVYNHGDAARLVQRKPHFREDMQRSDLGSSPSMVLLQHLQPAFWFSAHLHTKFPAIVPHRATGGATRFLSLDKCLPGRDFLQVLDIPLRAGVERRPGIHFDAEWLAILKFSHGLTPLTRAPVVLPQPRPVPPASLELVQLLMQRAGAPSHLPIPNNFMVTSVPFGCSPADWPMAWPAYACGGIQGNPQTDWLLNTLQLEHLVTVPYVPPPTAIGVLASMVPPPPVISGTATASASATTSASVAPVHTDVGAASASEPPPPKRQHVDSSGVDGSPTETHATSMPLAATNDAAAAVAGDPDEIDIDDM